MQIHSFASISLTCQSRGRDHLVRHCSSSSRQWGSERARKLLAVVRKLRARSLRAVATQHPQPALTVVFRAFRASASQLLRPTLPQSRQVYLDRVERLYADSGVSPSSPQKYPAAGFEPEYLECARGRVDEPRVADVGRA